MTGLKMFIKHYLRNINSPYRNKLDYSLIDADCKWDTMIESDLIYVKLKIYTKSKSIYEKHIILNQHFKTYFLYHLFPSLYIFLFTSY